MKKAFIVLLLILFFASFILTAFLSELAALLNVDFDATQYQRATSSELYVAKSSRTVLDDEGRIKYLFDDFSTYADTNKILSDFDTLNTIEIKPAAEAEILPQSVTGNSALSVVVNNPQTNLNILINNTVNLENWKNSGTFSFWLKINDRKDVAKITLEIEDVKGKTIALKPVENTQTSYPNSFNRDDVFPNISLVEQISSGEWTDYWLNAGWNYVFFQIDGSNSNQSSLDFTQIAKINLLFDTPVPGSAIVVDTLQIQNGIQKTNNLVNGNWYPPLGLPQYGVYSMGFDEQGRSQLYLLNVRNSQYPSNGDHGRILSKYAAPEKFALRIAFSLANFGDDHHSTWLRAFYDFDPEYDPGHDWFGTYISLEFNKFGVLTVIPVERFSIQTQEPQEKSSDSVSKKSIPELSSDREYELQIIVNGQNQLSTLYQKVGPLYIKIAEAQYTFERKRPMQKKYPFGIEITGNTHANIFEIELNKLDN